MMMSNNLFEGTKNTSPVEQKWKPLLEAQEDNVSAVTDPVRRAVLSQVLENQLVECKNSKEFMTETSVTGTTTANVQNYDPVLFGMIRRSLPSLIAFDVCGVQAMTAPTGLIFAMRPSAIDVNNTTQANWADLWGGGQAPRNLSGKTADTTAKDANANRPFTDTALTTPELNTTNAFTTSEIESAETLLSKSREMTLNIDRLLVSAKTRVLRAGYSVELAQDLKAIHGLSAERELTNMVTAEILSDINREVINTILFSAKLGATDTVSAGTFDLETDSSGRWSVERFKGLIYQIERDANLIARDSRRGKGNIIICSPDVASALAMTGLLDNNQAMMSGLEVDPMGNTYAGVLLGKYKVFIDPYAVSDYYVVGYKGQNASDAGVFYAPYVPLQMYRTVDSDNMQPRIAFKTRYAIVANPHAQGSPTGNGQTIADTITANSNSYYRKVRVKNVI